MSGQSKPPKSPFNFASGAWDKDQAAKYDQEQGLNDKDNAAKRFDPPSQNQNPAPNLAPPGMSGSKGGSSLPPETDEWVIEVALDELKIDISNDGSLTEGNFDNGTQFLVKMDYPDELDGESCITRLTLIESGEPVVHFEGSWILEPETEEREKMVSDLKEQFGDLHSNEFKSFDDINPDTGRDFDL